MGNVLDKELLILIWLVSIFIIMVGALFMRKYGNSSVRRRPPGPVGLPIIGHFHLLSSSVPHQSFHNLSLRYGPLFQLFLGSIPCVIVSSPEMAKEFLQTHDISFPNRPKFGHADYLTYGSAELVCGPYGPSWRFMKKITMTKLLGRQIVLDKFSPLMREERHVFLQALLEKAEAGEAVDVKAEVLRLINNMVTRMTVSRRFSGSEDDATRMRELLKEIMQLLNGFNFFDFFWLGRKLDPQGLKKKARKVHGEFDEAIERIIKAREEVRSANKSTREPVDFLDILLDNMGDEKEEMRLARENVKALIMDIFVGGSDTSTIAMIWGIAELINNPNIGEKARQQIDSVVGKDRIVEESDMVNLPYVEAIVREILRLHPPGALIGRESTEDCFVGGYHIPAKTQVFVSRWAIGRDPKYWEKPLEFWPDRFLREDGSLKGELDVRGQNFQLLPFGSGRRICPGISLALLVIQTTMAALIQCFEFRRVVGDDDDNGGNGRINMEEGLHGSRKHPLVCVPVARLNPFPNFTMETN